MDVANHALALWLAQNGHDVHLVAHEVDTELEQTANVSVHSVPKPLGSYMLGEQLLNVAGKHWARKIARRGGRIVVNGGNCNWGDVNWVHYVHAAYAREPAPTANFGRRFKERMADAQFCRNERTALLNARVIIANSNRTRQDLVDFVGISQERVRTIYLGVDAGLFRPPSDVDRESIRKELGWFDDRPRVAFIGALGDRRKGFDRLFAAWEMLCSDPKWDADLIVVGAGAELTFWKRLTHQRSLGERIHFLGFRRDVHRLLKACDALVAPTRYESYGLGVQEALCCGLPALVTETAGVAERYPTNLRTLLLRNSDSLSDLVTSIREWRDFAPEYAKKVLKLSDELRDHTWQKMASEIENVLESSY